MELRDEDGSRDGGREEDVNEGICYGKKGVESGR